MYDRDTQIEPRGLNTAAAARYLGLSTSFLEKARLNQTTTPGPPFRRKGKRILYLRNELDAYLESSDQGFVVNDWRDPRQVRSALTSTDHRPYDHNIYCYKPNGELYVVISPREWKRLRRQGKLDSYLDKQRR